MICPYCQTDNRDDREACYYCKKDLSMLRLIVNKAKHHYNQGLEYAERGRLDDAIGELKNALDLDGTMDNAHVVLGTLYAKKEMFAEARECWQRALAVNHNLEKAHEYLHKAEKAEHVFPAIHRLRLISATLAGLFAVFFAATLWLGHAVTKKDPDLEQVRQVALKLKEGNGVKLAVFYDELGEIASRKSASPMARDLAQGMNRQIMASWQSRLDLASGSSRSFNSSGAFQILESLRKEEAHRIPELMQSINRITSSAQENSIQRIGESYKQYLNGRLPYERFDMEASITSRFIHDEAARREVEKLKETAKKTEAERQLNEALDVILNGEIAKATRSVADWEARDAGTAAPLRQALEQRLSAENARAAADVRNFLDLKQFDNALARIEQYKLLYQEAGRPLPAGQLQALTAQVQTGRRKAAYDDAMEAFAVHDWPKFLELTQNPQSLSEESLDVARITAMRQEAEENRQREILAWFVDHEPEFKSGALTADDAATAIKTYPTALAHLALDPGVTTASLTLGVAAAHLKLAQPAQALELLKSLTAKYPKAPQAKTAAALIKKLEPAPAPKPGAAAGAAPDKKRGEAAPATSGLAARRRGRSEAPSSKSFGKK